MSGAGRRTKRPYADHKAVAAAAVATPGEWVRAGSYRAAYSARRVLHAINRGDREYGPTYSPAGAYEAEARTTEFDCEVWVRYLGQPAGIEAVASR